MRAARPPGPPKETRRHDPPGLGQTMDLAGALLLVVVASAAVGMLPEGDVARVALTLPVLFFAPGYLLMQAMVVPARDAKRRGVHAVAAVGVSPAVVGLLALATAIVPGGFRPAMIVTLVTLSCVALAATAYYRRATWTPQAAEQGDGVPRGSPVSRARHQSTSEASKTEA